MSYEGVWSAAGAVAAATVASACCILPVVFGGLGLSTVALAAVLEPVRPYFLAATVPLLGAGFYFTYVRGSRSAPGLANAGRPALWVATALAVSLAFFPSYAGIFAGDVTPPRPTGKQVPTQTMVLAIAGMTCEACVVGVQKELANVAGVLAAEVSFLDGSATLFVERERAPSPESLIAAVQRAGYDAEVR